MKKPVVSVVMITYCHENYINQAVNGVLMQKCDFDYEFIIANDCSPDNTDLVIHDIIKKNPEANIIKYFRHKKNMGIVPNFDFALKAAKGKYIAICEGDDYWTDPLKLKKQVDFLESHPDYSMSCHNATIIYEKTNKEPILFSKSTISHEIGMETIIEKWSIPTASMVFRREYIQNLPEWFDKIYSADFSLALLLRHYGKIWFFKDVMSVYRVDYTGSSASAIYVKKAKFVFNQHILLLDYFNNYTHFKYSAIIEKRISKIEEELKFMNLKEKGMINAFLRMPFVFLKKVLFKIYRLIKFKFI